MTLVFLGDRGEDDWAAIVAACTHVQLQPGEVLVQAGDVSRELLLVMEGSMEGAPVNGRPRAFLAPAVAGELAFLDGGQQELTLKAQTPVTVLRLSYDAYAGLAAEHPELGQAILADLGRLTAGRLRGAMDLLQQTLGR